MEEDKSNRRKKWEEETLKDHLEKHPEWKEEFTTTSSVPIKRLYSPSDISEFDYLKDLNFPSEYPFTRGVQPTMYRGRLWTMRMFSGFGTAEESNLRYKYLLDHGETGLKDMELLFDGIPLEKITTSMTINGPAPIVWGMYIAAAQKQGASPKIIGGTIQNDILKEYIAQKSYIFPPKPSMRLIVDTFEYGYKEVPRWNTISISGYHIREAGSTAVQELAFTLADGLTYVEEAKNRGLDVDDFAPRLSFFFNAHNDLFEEIAKYRAARRIWAREMKERFKAKNPRSWWLRFHTQTAGCSLTAQQPENNIVRVTIQALAAVLGGTQSLHTNSMDEALALPSEKAVRIALRTQQILAHESGVANTIDPVGGSYFVEALTNQMEEECYKYFDRIDAMGGVIPAIENGFFQKEIANASYKYQKEIENNMRTVVGVNDYVMDKPVRIELLEMDPEGEMRQVNRLKDLRKNRDNKKAEELLETLKSKAEGDDNLMPHILECVKAYCTLGEITDVFREVFGEYKEDPIY
jgi:methylmalonyl-CoA mutase N-terminal domain/subunit